jgi:hypothetical protein
MMSAQPFSGSSDETRGVCSSGRLYEFTVENNEGVEKRLWTTSCSSAKGSQKANLSTINQLFLRQIPEYRDRVPSL